MLYTWRVGPAVEIVCVSLTHREEEALQFSFFTLHSLALFLEGFFFFLSLLVSAFSELLPHGDKQEVHCVRDLNGSCPESVFRDV